MGLRSFAGFSSWQDKNKQAMGMLKKIPFLQGITERLGVYMASHDNLMKIVYKDSSTELPIRFETLDFNQRNRNAAISLVFTPHYS